jgi:hypothetical protein
VSAVSAGSSAPRRMDAAVGAVMAHDRIAALAGVLRDSSDIRERYDPGASSPGL